MKYLDVRAARHVYGDGIHDDTKALQDALDKMKYGGTVYFPDGVYLISAALIFYSNQWLKFSDRAVLKRSDKSETITRYMLASYSEPNVGGYEGTHDVVISGGIFDGNENLTENLTVINTVHCNNIVIKNCSFVHGANWHYIELNSTSDASVRDCVFDGRSYTAVRENLTSELVQLDAADENCYGPVYDWHGADGQSRVLRLRRADRFQAGPHPLPQREHRLVHFQVRGLHGHRPPRGPCPRKHRYHL